MIRWRDDKAMEVVNELNQLIGWWRQPLNPRDRYLVIRDVEDLGPVGTAMAAASTAAVICHNFKLVDIGYRISRHELMSLHDVESRIHKFVPAYAAAREIAVTDELHYEWKAILAADLTFQEIIFDHDAFEPAAIGGPDRETAAAVRHAQEEERLSEVFKKRRETLEYIALHTAMTSSKFGHGILSDPKTWT